jgi:hypothetical protein
MKIPGMDENTAEILYKEGMKNIKILASADPEKLASLTAIQEVSKEKATGWINEAAKIIADENNGQSA